MADTLVFVGHKNYDEQSAAAVSVDNASTYVLVATIICPKPGQLAVSGAVGSAGALAHLKMTSAAIIGGTHSDDAEDTDFNAGAEFIPSATTDPHTTSGSGVFKLRIRTAGRPEIAFYAKKASATTTLTLTVSHTEE